jgi:hypothetical protein
MKAPHAAADVAAAAAAAAEQTEDASCRCALLHGLYCCYYCCAGASSQSSTKGRKYLLAGALCATADYKLQQRHAGAALMFSKCWPLFLEGFKAIAAVAFDGQIQPALEQ